MIQGEKRLDRSQRQERPGKRCFFLPIQRGSLFVRRRLLQRAHCTYLTSASQEKRTSAVDGVDGVDWVDGVNFVDWWEEVGWLDCMGLGVCFQDSFLVFCWLRWAVRTR